MEGTVNLVLATVLVAALGTVASAQPPKDWPIHDENRPQPPVVDPGTPAERPAGPPSDAVVLFDGTDLTKWRSTKDGSPAKWTVENGYVQVVAGAGDIRTDQGFGDCQLHVEWATPVPGVGEGQHRGNSGVFLMGQYEVQVLDSHGNRTYPDGQAAALFGQYPPLVNASRPAGQWQTYDIIFRGPRFDAGGKLLRPARITVLHNGVLVQDDQELSGPTAHKSRPPYKAHPDKLPLGLQDHDDPVRYRNIWIRELAEPDPPLPRD
jgi:3-keto-disaccharide hydrolase